MDEKEQSLEGFSGFLYKIKGAKECTTSLFSP